MASSVDTYRLAAAGQIMTMLRKGPAFRDTVAAQEAGERPILIASIDDSLQEVIDRIHAIGPPVTLFVPGGSTSMTVISVRVVTGDEGAKWKQVPPDATMRTLVSQFWAQIPITFQL